ncbi:hypothetical protein KUTeg_010403 [Tegillarca granosa]|uniref:Uncharacterized protein n=1 Tax=Tegillarca granosa TaxID=220873 RepID=A0ABQ9F9U1_TEGGR|nr:hypothetical protein KUTeg_010403 [Tegillarca granosa]
MERRIMYLKPRLYTVYYRNLSIYQDYTQCITENLSIYQDYTQCITENLSIYQDYTQCITENLSIYQDYKQCITENLSIYQDYTQCITENLSIYQDYTQCITENLSIYQDYTQCITENLSIYQDYTQCITENLSIYQDYTHHEQSGKETKANRQFANSMNTREQQTEKKTIYPPTHSPYYYQLHYICDRIQKQDVTKMNWLPHCNEINKNKNSKYYITHAEINYTKIVLTNNNCNEIKQSSGAVLLQKMVFIYLSHIYILSSGEVVYLAPSSTSTSAIVSHGVSRELNDFSSQGGKVNRGFITSSLCTVNTVFMSFISICMAIRDVDTVVQADNGRHCSDKKLQETLKIYEIKLQIKGKTHKLCSSLKRRGLVKYQMFKFETMWSKLNSSSTLNMTTVLNKSSKIMLNIDKKLFLIPITLRNSMHLLKTQTILRLVVTLEIKSYFPLTRQHGFIIKNSDSAVECIPRKSI